MIKFLRISSLSVLLAVLSLAAYAGNDKKKAVDWMTPEEMGRNYVELEKPIIVDVYTDWCYYCKVMDKTTWRNDSVAAYVNAHFYPVKINAENTGDYTWHGEKYAYEPRLKVNMLAVKLLGGNMVYPSLVIIPVNGEPEILRGAFSAKELELILKYYGDKMNESTTPDAFMKKFQGKWK